MFFIYGIVSMCVRISQNLMNHEYRITHSTVNTTVMFGNRMSGWRWYDDDERLYEFSAIP